MRYGKQAAGTSLFYENSTQLAIGATQALLPASEERKTTQAAATAERCPPHLGDRIRDTNKTCLTQQPDVHNSFAVVRQTDSATCPDIPTGGQCSVVATAATRR